MKIDNETSKTQLIQRLKRIEGQVRGLQGMFEEERDCREIMQQLTAVHSAVRSASRVFFRDYASACLTQMNKKENGLSEKTAQITRERMLEEMIALLDKTP